MEEQFAPRKIGEKHYSIDVRGAVCPFPQLVTVRALSQLTTGDTLEVILDNPPSVKDIPPALQKRGYNVSEVTSVETGVWRIVIRL